MQNGEAFYLFRFLSRCIFEVESSMGGYWGLCLKAHPQGKALQISLEAIASDKVIEA